MVRVRTAGDRNVNNNPFQPSALNASGRSDVMAQDAITWQRNEGSASSLAAGSAR